MVWNNEKDELLMELDPYKARSREQGNVWKQIADVLNLISTACALHERCALLTNHKAEMRRMKLKQIGINPEDTP